jgi:hypothetical protein
VLHAHLVVHRLHVDGAEIDLRHATLVAVARAETARIDWEVVADAVAATPLDLGHHELEMLCITGADADGHLVLAELSGTAVLVRAVERTFVLRGDGDLAGLSLDLLGG